ncbi:MAG: PCP reductase family protein [Candidatus Margulisiibacteriota bacterium]
MDLTISVIWANSEGVHITWDLATREKFEQMISKIPVFLRNVAEKKVSQKAESLAQKDNRMVVSEKDLVDALFVETPFGFHGPMKNDMNELKIDYVKYGYQK